MLRGAAAASREAKHAAHVSLVAPTQRTTTRPSTHGVAERTPRPPRTAPPNPARRLRHRGQPNDVLRRKLANTHRSKPTSCAHHGVDASSSTARPARSGSSNNSAGPPTPGGPSPPVSRLVETITARLRRRIDYLLLYTPGSLANPAVALRERNELRALYTEVGLQAACPRCLHVSELAGTSLDVMKPRRLRDFQ